MNMLALTWGETTIVVDAGVMFPDPELLGVDLIIPDLTYLQQSGSVAALVLTHGHEDHIGGVPHVLPLRRRPGLRHAADAGAASSRSSRSTASTSASARRRCGRATASRSGRSTIEFIRVTHSMPDCVALAIHTPVGVDRPHRRLQDRSDAARRRALRRPPLRRARRRGRAGAVRRQHEHRSPRLHRLGARGRRRVRGDLHERRRASSIVAAFASSIYRMQILVDLAAQFDRKVAFVGRGMMRELARSRSGSAICASRPACRSATRDVGNYPAQDVLCLTTGSQGEPMSALSRIAIDDHRHVKLGAGRHGGASRRGRFPATRRRSAA